MQMREQALRWVQRFGAVLDAAAWGAVRGSADVGALDASNSACTRPPPPPPSLLQQPERGHHHLRPQPEGLPRGLLQRRVPQVPTCLTAAALARLQSRAGCGRNVQDPVLSVPSILLMLCPARSLPPSLSPAHRITGYSRREIIGRNCRFLQGPKTDLATVQRLATALHEVRAAAGQGGQGRRLLWGPGAGGRDGTEWVNVAAAASCSVRLPSWPQTAAHLMRLSSPCCLQGREISVELTNYRKNGEEFINLLRWAAALSWLVCKVAVRRCEARSGRPALPAFASLQNSCAGRSHLVAPPSPCPALLSPPTSAV